MTKQDLINKMYAVLDELSTYIKNLRQEIALPTTAFHVGSNNFSHLHRKCNTVFYQVDFIMDTLDELSDTLDAFADDDIIPQPVYQPCLNSIFSSMQLVRETSCWYQRESTHHQNPEGCLTEFSIPEDKN